MAKEMSMTKGESMGMGVNGRSGHLYMQTNEVKNTIIHYHRSGNGTLTEVERVATGGAGSGDRKSTRLNSSHQHRSRMPSSA